MYLMFKILNCQISIDFQKIRLFFVSEQDSCLLHFQKLQSFPVSKDVYMSGCILSQFIQFSSTCHLWRFSRDSKTNYNNNNNNNNNTTTTNNNNNININMNKFICIYIIIITLITTISSSFAFIQPSVPTRKIDSLYEKPWGSEGVSYDHTVLSTKHENVTTIQAFIGEFARRAILNGGSSRRRRLAAGDFDELNSLLEGTIFLLPDQFQNVDVPWPFTSVDIFLTQVQCTNVYIEDMILTSNVQSDAEIDVDVKIVNLGLRCTFKWRYDFGFTGSGSAYIVSTGNDVDTRIGFYSEDFNNHAPHSSRIEACSSQINVNDIHFQGGISGTILNLFKSSVKGMIEDEVTDMVCEEMSGMGSDTLSQSLSQISELFEPYLVGVTQNDPLDAQNNLVVPEGTYFVTLPYPISLSLSLRSTHSTHTHRDGKTYQLSRLGKLHTSNAHVVGNGGGQHKIFDSS